MQNSNLNSSHDLVRVAERAGVNKNTYNFIQFSVIKSLRCPRSSLSKSVVVWYFFLRLLARSLAALFIHCYCCFFSVVSEIGNDFIINNKIYINKFHFYVSSCAWNFFGYNNLSSSRSRRRHYCIVLCWNQRGLKHALNAISLCIFTFHLNFPLTHFVMWISVCTRLVSRLGQKHFFFICAKMGNLFAQECEWQIQHKTMRKILTFKQHFRFVRVFNTEMKHNKW